jgi:hypothetical protein
MFCIDSARKAGRLGISRRTPAVGVKFISSARDSHRSSRRPELRVAVVEVAATASRDRDDSAPDIFGGDESDSEIVSVFTRVGDELGIGAVGAAEASTHDRNGCIAMLRKGQSRAR